MTQSSKEISSVESGRIVTVGTFDGVHIGHRHLLNELVEYATSLRLRPLALILDPHPLTLVRPEAVPPCLSTFTERQNVVTAMGVEVRKLSFTEMTRRETSVMFMKRLCDEMDVKAMLIGHDNRFGSDRSSSMTDYVQTGSKLGIAVYEASCLPGVSSSAIRKVLLEGNMERGNELLGHTYSLRGTVVQGHRLGRTIGFPTANMQPIDAGMLIPPVGVYATLVSIDDSGPLLGAMTNIGYRPTVNGSDNSLSIETHIFDYTGNLYGRQVRLYFVSRMRKEKKFPTIEALCTSLRQDAIQARLLLKRQSIP